MSLVDYILLGIILAGAVAAIVFSLRKTKQGCGCSGCSGCSGSCAGNCAGCAYQEKKGS